MGGVRTSLGVLMCSNSNRARFTLNTTQERLQSQPFGSNLLYAHMQPLTNTRAVLDHGVQERKRCAVGAQQPRS